VINAGVTTDSAAWPASGAVIYLCSNNSSAEYSAPSISTRLLDVLNAAKIAVQYADTPSDLNLKTATVTDCGTGTCTLPVDQRIGTIYYRLEYWDVNGVLLENTRAQLIPSAESSADLIQFVRPVLVIPGVIGLVLA
jgi:hypothetical protein